MNRELPHKEVTMPSITIVKCPWKIPSRGLLSIIYGLQPERLVLNSGDDSVLATDLQWQRSQYPSRHDNDVSCASWTRRPKSSRSRNFHHHVRLVRTLPVAGLRDAKVKSAMQELLFTISQLEAPDLNRDSCLASTSVHVPRHMCSRTVVHRGE